MISSIVCIYIFTFSLLIIHVPSLLHENRSVDPFETFITTVNLSRDFLFLINMYVFSFLCLRFLVLPSYNLCLLQWSSPSQVKASSCPTRSKVVGPSEPKKQLHREKYHHLSEPTKTRLLSLLLFTKRSFLEINTMSLTKPQSHPLIFVLSDHYIRSIYLSSELNLNTVVVVS